MLAQRELCVSEQVDGLTVLLGKLQEYRLSRWRPRQAREVRFTPLRQSIEQARFGMPGIFAKVFAAIVQGITE